MEPINLYVLLTTLMPIAAYLIYIYVRDEYKKEPLLVLFIAVMLGIFSAYTFILGGFIDKDIIEGIFNKKWYECWSTGFLSCAIPGEVAKFIALSIFLLFNKYYDEYVDAVVYSVCVALGFIGIINGWYLYNNEDNQLVRGLMSAFVLIPCPFYNWNGYGLFPLALQNFTINFISILSHWWQLPWSMAVSVRCYCGLTIKPRYM